MRGYVPRIHQAGGELVVIGNGTGEQAGWFREDTGLEVPLFTDPSLKTYEAVGARRGLLSSLNPGTIRSALRARRSGFRQSRTQGSAFQQGGVFVITPDGEMPYRYVSSFAGDHPGPEDVVRALETVAPPA